MKTKNQFFLELYIIEGSALIYFSPVDNRDTVFIKRDKTVQRMKHHKEKYRYLNIKNHPILAYNFTLQLTLCHIRTIAGPLPIGKHT